MKKIISTLILSALMLATVVAFASCGLLNPPAPAEHQHTMTKVDEKPASCIEAGTKAYYKCDECKKLFADAEGAKEIAAPEATEKLGHSFTDYKSNNDATCTADGTKTAKCDRCDETDTIADVDSKKGHSFKNYVSDENATCTADGTETAKCDNCTAEDTRTDVDSKLNHSYTVKTVSNDTCKSAADCNNAAVYYFSCACGEISNSETFEDGTSLGHDYTEKIVDDAHFKAEGADCQTKDTYWYDCSRCASISDELFFEGEGVGEHKVSSDWTTADGKHFHKCTVDGCDYTEGEEACSDVDTDDNHKCDVCSAEGVTSHAYGDWANAGENHKKTCNCGDVVTETHAWNESGRTPATHLEEGKVDYSCTCGATKSDVLTKTPDHSYGDWTAVEGTDNHSRKCACGDEQTEAHTWVESGKVEPTHESQGSITYACDVCKATKTEEIPAITDHTYNQEKVEEKYIKSGATCTSAAVYYKSCVCGAFSNADDAATFTYGDALPHTESEWAVESVDAENQTAVLVYTCSACENPITKNITFADCQNYVVAAKCEEEGSETYTYVYTLSDAEKSIVVYIKALSALEHDYDAVVTDPTCEAQGYTTYTCNNDASHTYVDNYVDATGHTAVPCTTEFSTTVENSDITAGTKCSVCGTTLSTATVYGPFDIVADSTNKVFSEHIELSKVATSFIKSRVNDRGVAPIGDIYTGIKYVVFNVNSTKSETVALYIEFGNLTTENKFSDWANIIVNEGTDNEKTYTSDAAMPVGTQWYASNKYVFIGYISLVEGNNTVKINITSSTGARNLYGVKFAAETAEIAWEIVEDNDTIDDSEWNQSDVFYATTLEQTVADGVEIGSKLKVDNTNTAKANNAGYYPIGGLNDAKGQSVTFNIYSTEATTVGLYAEFTGATNGIAFSDWASLIVNDTTYSDIDTVMPSGTAWRPSNTFVFLGFYELKAGNNTITIQGKTKTDDFTPKDARNIFGIKFTVESDAATLSMGSTSTEE